jgi:hypothetical protein
MPYFKMQELITPTTAYSQNSPNPLSIKDASIKDRLSSLNNHRVNTISGQLTHYEPTSVFSNNFNLQNQNPGLKTQKLNP